MFCWKSRSHFAVIKCRLLRVLGCNFSHKMNIFSYKVITANSKCQRIRIRMNWAHASRLVQCFKPTECYHKFSSIWQCSKADDIYNAIACYCLWAFNDHFCCRYALASHSIFLFFALHCSLHISLDVAVLCPCTYCSIIAQNQRRNLKTCQAHRTRNNVLRFVLTNVLSYIFLFSVC